MVYWSALAAHGIARLIVRIAPRRIQAAAPSRAADWSFFRFARASRARDPRSTVIRSAADAGVAFLVIGGLPP
jgi:hypothetical protein